MFFTASTVVDMPVKCSLEVINEKTMSIKLMGPALSFEALACTREYKRGKCHLYRWPPVDWFGISCMTTDNFCFYLQNRLIQTSLTGGQWYSDTCPFSIPCLYYKNMTIVNDDLSIISKWSSKLIDNARVIIYDLNMFIILVIGVLILHLINYFCILMFQPKLKF